MGQNFVSAGVVGNAKEFSSKSLCFLFCALTPYYVGLSGESPCAEDLCDGARGLWRSRYPADLLVGPP